MVKRLSLDHVIRYLFLTDKFPAINELSNLALFKGFYNFRNSLTISLSH